MTSQCSQDINANRFNFLRSRQCRKAGTHTDTDGRLYCAQHFPPHVEAADRAALVAIEDRLRKSRENFEARQNQARKADAYDALRDAVREYFEAADASPFILARAEAAKRRLRKLSDER